MTVAAILIATEQIDGLGEPLALTAWTDTETLLEWQIAQIRAAGVRDIEVVVGPDAERVLPSVTGDNVEAVIDARRSDDAASALRVGASAVPRGTTAALIVRLSEPRSVAVCAAMLEAHAERGGAITRPATGAGSPIVVNQEVLAAMRNFSGGDLDALVASFEGPIVGVAPGDYGVLPRIASADDVARVREMMAG